MCASKLDQDKKKHNELSHSHHMRTILSVLPFVTANHSAHCLLLLSELKCCNYLQHLNKQNVPFSVDCNRMAHTHTHSGINSQNLRRKHLLMGVSSPPGPLTQCKVSILCNMCETLHRSSSCCQLVLIKGNLCS